MGLDYLKINTNEKGNVLEQTFDDKVYNEYRNNPAFKKAFVDVVALLPQIINKYFPGVEFSHYGRIKSKNSNHSKQLSNTKNNKPAEVFDNFAFKVVIKSVSDDLEIASPEVVEAQKKLLFSRQQLEDRKSQLEIASKQLDTSSSTLHSKNSALNYAKTTKDVIEKQVEDLNNQLQNTKNVSLTSKAEYDSLIKKIDAADVSVQPILNEFKSALAKNIESFSQSLKIAEHNLELAHSNLESAIKTLQICELDSHHAKTEFDISKLTYENATDAVSDAKNNLALATDSLNIAVSNAIANFLVADDSPFLKELNATRLYNRDREYAKSNGYVANHKTISIPVNSNFIDNCNIEMQFRSEYRDILAKGNHDEFKKEKHSLDRVFPVEKFRNCKTPDDLQELMESVPTYIIYDANGRVVECSSGINFYYFYLDYFTEQKADENGNNTFVNDDDYRLLLSNPLFDFHNKALNTDLSEPSKKEEER